MAEVGVSSFWCSGASWFVDVVAALLIDAVVELEFTVRKLMALHVEVLLLIAAHDFDSVVLSLPTANSLYTKDDDAAALVCRRSGNDKVVIARRPFETIEENSQFSEPGLCFSTDFLSLCMYHPSENHLQAKQNQNLGVQVGLRKRVHKIMSGSLIVAIVAYYCGLCVLSMFITKTNAKENQGRFICMSITNTSVKQNAQILSF